MHIWVSGGSSKPCVGSRWDPREDKAQSVETEAVPLSKEDKVENQHKRSRAGRRRLTHVRVCGHLWAPVWLSSVPPGCCSGGRERLKVPPKDFTLDMREKLWP